MAEDEMVVRRLFDRIQFVEWSEEKAAGNRHKHGIDFDDAIEIFYGATLLRRSDRHQEERWIAIGELKGRLLAVIFTWRGSNLRIISARGARTNEKRAYRRQAMGRTSEGQD